MFRVTIPAQRLTTSSNYVSLTGTTPIKLRGTSDMVTEEGKIHNYRMDYKKQVTILDYAPGGTTTGAGLYNTGSNCTVSASVKPGYEFAGWYEGGRIVSGTAQYSFEVLADRTLEPKYRNYGSWRVTPDGQSFPPFLWKGGTSTLSAGAHGTYSSMGLKRLSREAHPLSAEVRRDFSFR